MLQLFLACGLHCKVPVGVDQDLFSIVSPPPAPRKLNPGWPRETRDEASRERQRPEKRRAANRCASGGAAHEVSGSGGGAPRGCASPHTAYFVRGSAAPRSGLRRLPARRSTRRSLPWHSVENEV